MNLDNICCAQLQREAFAMVMWVTMPPLLTCDTNRKGSHLSQDLLEQGTARMASPGELGHQGHQPFLEEKQAELYRLQELLMDRLHIINSFTLMEIPGAVWPREGTWSLFKGPSSEFPTLAFSYHLSLLFWAELCRAAGAEDGVGVKGKELSQSNAFHTLLG